MGNSAIVNILNNDTQADTPFDLTTIEITGTTEPGEPLTVEGEGVWTIDTTAGTVTFTPEEGFTDNPTPITYSVRDTNGNTVSAQVTITYPTAEPEAERSLPLKDRCCQFP